MSGAWRVTYSLRSLLGDARDDNQAYIYFNGNTLPETYHNTYSGKGGDRQTGGLEFTLAADVGNTIDLRTGLLDGQYNYIYFCVAFEHGPDHQSQTTTTKETG